MCGWKDLCLHEGAGAKPSPANMAVRRLANLTCSAQWRWQRPAERRLLALPARWPYGPASQRSRSRRGASARCAGGGKWSDWRGACLSQLNSGTMHRASPTTSRRLHNGPKPLVDCGSFATLADGRRVGSFGPRTRQTLPPPLREQVRFADLRNDRLVFLGVFTGLGVAPALFMQTQILASAHAIGTCASSINVKVVPRPPAASHRTGRNRFRPPRPPISGPLRRHSQTPNGGPVPRVGVPCRNRSLPCCRSDRSLMPACSAAIDLRKPARVYSTHGVNHSPGDVVVA